MAHPDLSISERSGLQTFLHQKLPHLALALDKRPGLHTDTRFGANTALDSGDLPETIWTVGGLYVYPTVGVRLEVVSGEAADTGDPEGLGTGLQKVVIVGLDDSYNEVSEEVIMDGVTPVLTVRTNWLRQYRSYGTDVGTGGVNAGQILVRIESGGNTLSSIEIGVGESQQALVTVPANHSGSVDFIGAVATAIAGSEEVKLGLFTRFPGESWRLRFPFGIRGAGSSSFERGLVHPMALPPLTDVEIRAIGGDPTAAGVVAWFDYTTIEVV